MVGRSRDARIPGKSAGRATAARSSPSPIDAEADFVAKVLLVETVRTRRALYQFDLERDGHEIITASTPSEAIELLEEERPQVVVLDPDETGMEGMEAMMRVHDRTGAVRVVVISTPGGGRRS